VRSADPHALPGDHQARTFAHSDRIASVPASPRLVAATSAKASQSTQHAVRRAGDRVTGRLRNVRCSEPSMCAAPCRTPPGSQCCAVDGSAPVGPRTRQDSDTLRIAVPLRNAGDRTETCGSGFPQMRHLCRRPGAQVGDRSSALAENTSGGARPVGASLVACRAPPSLVAPRSAGRQRTRS
jgi:hypothetical protein